MKWFLYALSRQSAIQLLYFSISDFKASSLFAEVKLRMLVDRIKCFDIGFPVLSMRCYCNNPHHPRPWACLVHPSERSCTPLFLSNFTNKSFLYLNFLKQFFSEDSNPCVLITLSNQFTSYESNSASSNGLQAVFPSNFPTNILTKGFFVFGFFKKSLALITESEKLIQFTTMAWLTRITRLGLETPRKRIGLFTPLPHDHGQVADESGREARTGEPLRRGFSAAGESCALWNCGGGWHCGGSGRSWYSGYCPDPNMLCLGMWAPIKVKKARMMRRRKTRVLIA